MIRCLWAPPPTLGQCSWSGTLPWRYKNRKCTCYSLCLEFSLPCPNNYMFLPPNVTFSERPLLITLHETTSLPCAPLSMLPCLTYIYLSTYLLSVSLATLTSEDKLLEQEPSLCEQCLAHNRSLNICGMKRYRILDGIKVGFREEIRGEKSFAPFQQLLK